MDLAPVTITPVTSTSNMPTYPVLDLTSDNIKSFVYVKTNIGGWFFDAILNMQHSSDLTITSHPVEIGTSVTDFAYMNPRKLSMSIGMTDTAQSFISGQFSGGASRSSQAWQVLQDLQTLRIPIQVYTRLGLYQNMLIASLSTTDDNTTNHALKATVDFQELLVAKVSKVKVSSAPATTTNAKKGKQQPQQVPPSLLYDLEKLLTG